MIWPQGGESDLSAREPILCHWCQSSRFYRWQRRVRKSAFLAALSDLIGYTPSLEAEPTLEVSDQGFVSALWVRNGDQQVRIAGEALRSTIGRQLGWNLILSNVYTLDHRGGWFVFQGRGFGHNVGFCLNGATAQARAGRRLLAILRYYFPVAKLKDVESRQERGQW